jgi:hypothetical protein
MLRLNRNIRYTVMALALGLSAIMGVAAFEWVSPISMFHWELISGLGLGWMAIFRCVSVCSICAQERLVWSPLSLGRFLQSGRQGRFSASSL